MQWNPVFAFRREQVFRMRKAEFLSVFLDIIIEIADYFFEYLPIYNMQSFKSTYNFLLSTLWPQICNYTCTSSTYFFFGLFQKSLSDTWRRIQNWLTQNLTITNIAQKCWAFFLLGKENRKSTKHYSNIIVLRNC